MPQPAWPRRHENESRRWLLWFERLCQETLTSEDSGFRTAEETEEEWATEAQRCDLRIATSAALGCLAMAGSSKDTDEPMTSRRSAQADAEERGQLTLLALAFRPPEIPRSLDRRDRGCETLLESTSSWLSACSWQTLRPLRSCRLKRPFETLETAFQVTCQAGPVVLFNPFFPHCFFQLFNWCLKVMIALLSPRVHPWMRRLLLPHQPAGMCSTKCRYWRSACLRSYPEADPTRS